MGQHDTRPTCVTMPTKLYGGGRVSAQRIAIARVVERMRGAFTAEDLYCAVTASHPGIGLATVYRAIAAMQSAGALVPVGQRDGSVLLALCERHDHHHHLVCTECGTVIPVDCPIHESAACATSDQGYLVTSHQVVLYGICAGCRQGTRDV